MRGSAELAADIELIQFRADMPLDTIFLDTNVVIELARLYFGPTKKNRVRRPEDGEVGYNFIEKFPTSDLSRLAKGEIFAKPFNMNPALGLLEASISRTRGFDLEKFGHLNYGVQSVLDWTVSDIAKWRSSKRYPTERDKDRQQKDYAEYENVSVSQIPHLVAVYAQILKAVQIRRGIGVAKLDGVRGFKARMKWVRDEVRVMMTEPSVWAAEFFCGTPESKRIAKHSLKFGGNEEGEKACKNAWGLAWDINLIRFVEGYSNGLIDGKIHNHAIATRDSDPGGVEPDYQQQFHLRYSVGNSHVLSVVSPELDDEYRSEVTGSSG